MKISNQKISKIQGKETTDGNLTTSSTAFKSMLKKIDGPYNVEYLNELFSEIDKQGKRLIKSFNINELKYYKRVISEFLDAAVNSSYSYEKEKYSDREGKRTIHSIVKRVNDEVECLMKRVMSGEKNNIDILEKVDEIRGLLLDILM